MLLKELKNILEDKEISKMHYESKLNYNVL